jgi:hypothetical protein
MAPGPCTRPAWVGKAPPGVEGRNAVDVVSELFGGLKLGLLKMLKIPPELYFHRLVDQEVFKQRNQVSEL